MKVKSLIIVVLFLSINLSCSLFFREKYMFDRNNLQEALAVFKGKGNEKTNLAEIEITYNKVAFNTGTKKIAYAKGFMREVEFKSPSGSKNFLLDEIDSFDLNKAMSAAIELTKKNPYMKEAEVSRIVITKQEVSRNDNLVSNVGRRRDAMRCDIYVVDADGESHYTTNLQGEIVDVAETNVKPRIKFFDAEQMKKSVAEIQTLFGGKLSVADFSIQTENFSFTALDPKNPDEQNYYRFNSQEFLRAGTSLTQKTLEDKKRDEEMRRGGTPENIIQMRYISAIFFDIEEIDFSLIPQVMEKTLAAAKASNAKVSTIRISKREDQFKKTVELEWRVETYGDRSEKESVIFDGKGNLKIEGN